MNGRAPPYLADYCIPVTSADTRWHLPPATCSTSLLAQHLWPSDLFSCRPYSLELSRPSVQTVSGVRLKRICSLDTRALNALQVLDDNCAL